MRLLERWRALRGDPVSLCLLVIIAMTIILCVRAVVTREEPSGRAFHWLPLEDGGYARITAADFEEATHLVGTSVVGTPIRRWRADAHCEVVYDKVSATVWIRLLKIGPKTSARIAKAVEDLRKAEEQKKAPGPRSSE